MRRHLGPSRRLFLALALAGGTSLAATGVALAQADWPSRPVTMVVPYGPGASNDLFTRAVADVMSRELGQPFVVENRPGAGGFTGTDEVSNATPDGYTLVEMPNSIVGFKPLMQVDLEPLTDLTPIALLARSPVVMAVPVELPVNSVQEFIDYAKANPDTTFYGMAGIGTTQQQHAELFNAATGLKLQPVNYQSSADAQTDLVAGRLQVMFITVASVRGQVEGGQLKVLAYTDDNYPEGSLAAPTMAELGIEGMEKAQIFWGLYGPPGMDEALVARINEAVNVAIMDPSFVTLAANSGATPAPGTAADFVAVLEAETATVADFVEMMPAQ